MRRNLRAALQSRPAPALRHSATPRPRRHRASANGTNLKKFGRFAQFVRPAVPAILQCAPLRISDFIPAGIFSSARRTKCAPRNGASETRRRTRSKRVKPMRTQRQQLQRGGQIQTGAQAQMQSAPTRTRKARGRLATGRLSKNCKFSARPKKNAARQTAAKRFFQNATP